MHILSRETERVQNPALGSMILWRFAVGYQRGSGEDSPTPIPLLFIVLPIILHEETARLVKSTQERSGLRSFAGKFSSSAISKSDLLFAIHRRALDMRQLTTESLAIALSSGLISIYDDTGCAVPLSSSPVRAGIPSSVSKMLKSAEKIGVWCSQISLHEISVILKVGF